jgi:c-di-GMP-binding flagellar brake protein YcgR
LRVLGREYQRLTFVVGVEEKGSKRYLLVDCPVDLSETIHSPEGAGVRIDFMGADKLQYSFRTAITRISDQDLWLEYPEFIERIQRRRYFRITPPAGTTIRLPFGDQVHEAEVLNLSVGGSLLRVTSIPSGDTGLKVGDCMTDVTLTCRSGEPPMDMRIEETTVRRIDKDEGTGRPLYALEFTRMNKKEARTLGQFICYCEIAVLRRRTLETADG